MDKPVNTEKSCLVILSGGQDSTTCLYWAKQRFARISAVTFDYGQRHSREIDAARAIASLAGVKDHEVIDIRGLMASTSPLIDMDRPVEEYGSVDELPGGLEDTFVPCRNALFLTIAANRAYVKGILDLVIGVSAVDYGGYPDCRPEFILLQEEALCHGLDAEMTIHAPLIAMTKKETVLLATTLPGCMDALALSHTCYEGKTPPCGKCHACLLREKGFQEAEITDPISLK